MVGIKFRLQSATEYLLTYGWAFLIAVIVVASLYLFIFAPSAIAPSSCTFTSGVYCQDLILGSSATLSKMAMLLTNSNPYPIINPKIILNLSGTAPIQGACVPNFILPGGAVICNTTITPALSQGALASGRFIFSYTPCPGGSVVQCQNNARQSYLGSFNTHSSPLLSPTTITITLTPQNTSQVALSSSLDKLTATVRLLGTPLSGATVNFTSNSISAPVAPLVITTDGSGNAASYISSSMSGNVFVTASFANTVANAIIAFTPPVCFTISVPGLFGSTSNALTVDGVGYSSFPRQLCYGQGTSHSYSFQTTIAGAAGVQYLFNSVSGCGATTQSGTLSGVANCTLSGNYLTQYYLTTSASPGIGGSVTPPSGWYNSGNSATLGETPSAGYAFNGWTGSGSGSYTGSNTAPLITLNNPITETGSFTSTSSSTTSTSTTSTTTTVLCSGTFGGSATGGTVTYSSGNEIHTFTSSGTFTYSGSSCSASVLVVGGGGGGGGTSAAGGGGAGGFVYAGAFTINPNTYSVTVGAGGAGEPNPSAGMSGSSSSFGTLVALGGGGGSGGPGAVCSSGGSGGGASNWDGACAGTAGQGNGGGASGDLRTGGGGGGAGAVGGLGYYGPVHYGGPGGAGLPSSISGTLTYYAGGGGGGESGGCGCEVIGQGGIGGGGNGGGYGPGSSATPNTGGGGGGGAADNGGGNGGSGIVIISLNGLQSTTTSTSTTSTTSTTTSTTSTSTIPYYTCASSDTPPEGSSLRCSVSSGADTICAGSMNQNGGNVNPWTNGIAYSSGAVGFSSSNLCSYGFWGSGTTGGTAGIGFTPSSGFTKFLASGAVSGPIGTCPAFSFSYNVVTPGAFVITAMGVGYFWLDNIYLPSGCSIVTSAGDYSGSYLAVCSAQQPGHYTITVNTCHNGAAPQVAAAVYVFPS
ncbi:MAG: Ig-like domain-containing protein [Candidatus Micrarchaeota archaeon]|nr:Ig-like domain-containing protein [Candidatus Micrarchaeota archaeon]